MRWKTYFDALTCTLNGQNMPLIDWYAIEEPWARMSNTYSSQPEGESVEIAKRVYSEVFE